MPTSPTSPHGLAADATGGRRPAPHLILVGLPGAGKSTVGRALAARLGREFLDFDVEIERREQKTVAEIFAASGEPHFRALERGLTEEVRRREGMVLAPGGGWMANPGCLELLRPPAQLVYLQVSPETALTRMGTGMAERPLLRRADPLAEVHRLLADREQLYLQSNHIVSSEMMTLDQVVQAIVVLAGGGLGD